MGKRAITWVDELYVKGLNKFSYELRKDILEGRFRVKKTIIKKIGSDDSIIEVLSREELEGLSL